ncbi:hypothetical protein SAMN05443665_10953 [Actinomadura meyerae]|jgi:hypothetical protein|uniref:Uncharacterized protein n=1 Tax=Actinomadura meyerae TaxID=240840 RepID=A0A239P811_9ACTN|nr:hypothetical protein SAMN05443665_10953 [Actinomadura meyerae]
MSNPAYPVPPTGEAIGALMQAPQHDMEQGSSPTPDVDDPAGITWDCPRLFGTPRTTAQAPTDSPLCQAGGPLLSGL